MLGLLPDKEGHEKKKKKTKEKPLIHSAFLPVHSFFIRGSFIIVRGDQVVLSPFGCMSLEMGGGMGVRMGCKKLSLPHVYECSVPKAGVGVAFCCMIEWPWTVLVEGNKKQQQCGKEK